MKAVNKFMVVLKWLAAAVFAFQMSLVHAAKPTSDISEITLSQIPDGIEWCQSISIGKIQQPFDGWVQFDVVRPGSEEAHESISVKTTLPYKVRYRAAFNLSEVTITNTEAQQGVLTKATFVLIHPKAAQHSAEVRCALVFSGRSDGELWGVNLKRLGKGESLLAEGAVPKPSGSSKSNTEAENIVSDESDTTVNQLEPKIVPVDSVKNAFYSLSQTDREAVQEGLASAGFYNSSVDGIYGPGTRAGILRHLTSVDVSSEDEGSIETELIALTAKVLAERKQRLVEQQRIAALEAAKIGEQVTDQFMLEDIMAFVADYPGSFNPLELAIRFTPAKLESDAGGQGIKFEELKTFVSSNETFTAYARTRQDQRDADSKRIIDERYAQLVAERDLIEKQIADNPFSEDAMEMTLTLLRYRDISRDSTDGEITAALEEIRREMGNSAKTAQVIADLPVAGDQAVDSNTGAPLVADKLERVQKVEETAVLAKTGDQCSANAALCSLEQLCERATSYATGRLDWDSSEEARPYIEFANRFGMRCGVGPNVNVAISETVDQTVQKARIAKYKNRKALVIGNANYSDQEPLKNPINDAKAVSAKLKEVGFEVTYRENLGVRDFGRALSDFETSLKGSDISLFYYAGHGIEIEKQNYLIPVDANIRSAGDVRYETVRLDDAVDVALNTSKLSMVLIDACRDNPFSSQMRDRTRSVGRGLSVVEVNTGPVYQIVSFAASSGQVAEDGDGQNSPYASVLVDLLDEPNLEVGKMFRLLGDRVSQLTNGAQQPTKRDNLRGEDIFLVQY